MEPTIGATSTAPSAATPAPIADPAAPPPPPPVAGDAAPPPPAAPPAAAAADPTKDRSDRIRQSVEIAKQRSALRKQETEIKAQAEAAAKWTKLEELRRTNPAEAQRFAQIDLDAAARGMATPDPAAEAAKKLETVEEKVDRMERERVSAASAALVQAGIQNVAKQIEAVADDFPLTYESGASERVFALMAELYNEHQVELTVAEAAAEVEAQLKVEAEEPVVRAQQRREKKKAATQSPPVQEPSRSEPPRATPSAQQPTTISSRMAGEPPSAGSRTYDSARHRAEVLARFSARQ